MSASLAQRGGLGEEGLGLGLELLGGAGLRQALLLGLAAALPLRLLGAGATQKRAIAELNALPSSEWEPRDLILLLALPMKVPQDHTEEDDMSYVEELRTTYRRVQGEGIRRALVGTYEARFGLLPPGLREAIEAMEDESTLMRWVGLFSTATADEIAATLLTGKPAPQSA